MAGESRDTTEYKSTDGTPVHSIKTSGAGVLEIIAKFSIPNETAAESIFRICEVPSNFVLVEGSLAYDGGTGTGTVDVGLFETEENGKAEIDDDMFIDGQSITSAGAKTFDQVAVADLDKTLYELVNAVESRDDKSACRQAYVVGVTLATGDTDTGATVCVLKLRLVRKS